MPPSELMRLFTHALSVLSCLQNTKDVCYVVYVFIMLSYVGYICEPAWQNNVHKKLTKRT